MKRFRISGIEELLRKEGMNEMKTEEECGWIEKISTISKKEEFIRFLEDLSSDYQQHFEEWENTTISDYLRQMASWIDDDSTSPSSNIAWTEVDFQVLAKILYMGKLYE